MLIEHKLYNILLQERNTANHVTNQVSLKPLLENSYLKGVLFKYFGIMISNRD